MATIQLSDQVVSIRFTPAEKVFGLVRDLDLPRSAVAEATVEPDGLRAVRGLRSPGLALPGARKVGTWRNRRERTLVSVRAGQPALALRLFGQRHDHVLIGVDDPQQYASLVPDQR